LFGADPRPAGVQRVGTPAAPLEVLVSGSGPRVVLVHGSNISGPLTWAEQRPLAARWQLEIVNRRGYGNSPPPAVRQDFEADAEDIAALLGEGAHLVGHSYGAIGCLYAAALRPQAVRSLTINEPPAFGLIEGDSAADALGGTDREDKERLTRTARVRGSLHQGRRWTRGAPARGVRLGPPLLFPQISHARLRPSAISYAPW
jgi:pimeloyl-ACP methyl ester carboxylesterase